MEQDAVASLYMLFHGFWFACSWIDIAPATSREKDNSTILFFVLFLSKFSFAWSYIRVRKDSDQKEKKKAHSVFFFLAV